MDSLRRLPRPKPYISLVRGQGDVCSDSPSWLALDDSFAFGRRALRLSRNFLFSPAARSLGKSLLIGCALCFFLFAYFSFQLPVCFAFLRRLHTVRVSSSSSSSNSSSGGSTSITDRSASTDSGSNEKLKISSPKRAVGSSEDAKDYDGSPEILPVPGE